MELSAPAPRRATALLLAFAAAIAQGLPEDSDQELVIQANEAVYDTATGVNVLTGAVRIDQGTLHVEANRVTTTSTEQRLRRIVAEGDGDEPATLRQRVRAGEPPVTARAARIDYAVAEGQLELRGGAFLQQGDRQVGGDVISWDMKEGRVSARSTEPGGVTTKWQPKPTVTGD